MNDMKCQRKALKIAVDALKLISLRYLCEYADKALDQIKQITTKQKGVKSVKIKTTLKQKD